MNRITHWDESDAIRDLFNDLEREFKANNEDVDIFVGLDDIIYVYGQNKSVWSKAPEVSS